ncbi:AAA family ATPase [Intestinibacter bartlettii]|uniref:nucleotide-binding protein n=1 Tax=Intestinibacter bartlettii TaxID=261299 RepID=UPI00082288F8|nr:nitrogenase iron protein NifH [Intestinibacter bartlettii]SCI42146.1 Nitrogenase iron protein 1 [uncultured Clostridium sp.]
MIKIAVYGKGGIGKSTTISNLSVALANKGLKVMQIGCDPKADSTTNLHDGSEINTVLDLVRERKDDFKLDEMVVKGYKGILCVEAGGPTPGMGCAGRGIIAALEKLEQKGAYETYKPDIVFYDVLGDVVCGGFSMPMRAGYADKIFIITSGEYMAIHAAINIATAIDNFKDRGYASLGGVILNKRNVKNEEKKVNEFIENIDSKLVGILDRDEIVVVAEEDKKTVLEAFPESLMAKEYEVLADNLLKACGYKVSEGNLEKLNNKKVKSDNKDESNDTKKEEAKC